MVETRSNFASLPYTTERLSVSNVRSWLLSESLKTELLLSVTTLLTLNVVQSLPPYFHHINTRSDAEQWLDTMLSESHLFTVQRKEKSEIIGFLFLYESDNAIAHLGYLLGESFWQKGYGKELLLGFIHTLKKQQINTQLMAGVDVENHASVQLLEKVGFIRGEKEPNGTVFYRYSL